MWFIKLAVEILCATASLITLTHSPIPLSSYSIIAYLLLLYTHKSIHIYLRVCKTPFVQFITCGHVWCWRSSHISWVECLQSMNFILHPILILRHPKAIFTYYHIWIPIYEIPNICDIHPNSKLSVSSPHTYVLWLPYQFSASHSSSNITNLLIMSYYLHHQNYPLLEILWGWFICIWSVTLVAESTRYSVVDSVPPCPSPHSTADITNSCP